MFIYSECVYISLYTKYIYTLSPLSYGVRTKVSFKFPSYWKFTIRSYQRIRGRIRVMFMIFIYNICMGFPEWFAADCKKIKKLYFSELIRFLCGVVLSLSTTVNNIMVLFLINIFRMSIAGK